MKLLHRIESNPRSGLEETRFGMLTGVYVPTLLTIIGVIMYLRLGWVVGSVGLLGSWLIIVVAFSITTTTALSMASIISNIRIGSGGAFSIITRSLGIEIGGSIGVPFYLSMTLSVVLYIFGFREGLLFLFPELSSLLVDFIVFAVVFGIVLFSTDIAFRLQYLILAILICSLFVIVGSGLHATPSFEFSPISSENSFWIVFAVFFPAATGIMAGANMSGELENPRKSIPIGTLAAIGTSFIVYLSLSYWLAGATSPEELVSNYTIMFDMAIFRWVALAGLLAATFSSAMNSVIGASRVLQAMADHAIMPYSTWFAYRGKSGIPRNAILLTAGITLLALMLRDLNTIAPLITMFFLITYGTINIVILIEQKLNLVSFRPLLKIPIYIPLMGAIGTLFTMFIINPAFSLVAIMMIILLYNLLMSRHITTTEPEGDVRSSLFVSLAEWAAKKSMTLPRSHGRAWRPNILIPAVNSQEIKGVSEFLRDITFPSGLVSILGIESEEVQPWLEQGLIPLVDDFRNEGIYSSYTTIRSGTLHEGVLLSIQAMKSAFFGPNILFLRKPVSLEQRDEIITILSDSTSAKLGIIMYMSHPRAGLGRRRIIQLFIPKNCSEWRSQSDGLNFDLALLIAYKLKLNWDAELHLVIPIDHPDEEEPIRVSVKELLEYARISITHISVITSPYEVFLQNALPVDLNIFWFIDVLDFAYAESIVTASRATCLFCRDSLDENVFA
jgi:amino acid transporter